MCVFHNSNLIYCSSRQEINVFYLDLCVFFSHLFYFWTFKTYAKFFFLIFGFTEV